MHVPHLMYTQNPSPLRFSSNYVDSLIWLHNGDMQILKTTGSLLVPFWADLRESLSVYPKSRKISNNFPTALVPSIIILQLFFSYHFLGILGVTTVNRPKKTLKVIRLFSKFACHLFIGKWGRPQNFKKIREVRDFECTLTLLGHLIF